MHYRVNKNFHVAIYIEMSIMNCVFFINHVSEELLFVELAKIDSRFGVH